MTAEIFSAGVLYYACTSTFQGWFVVQALELATINLPAKLKSISTATRKKSKDGTKCEKWGGLGLLGGHSRSPEIALCDRAQAY